MGDRDHRKYWLSLEHREGGADVDAAAQGEFAEELPVGPDAPPSAFTRRGFVAAMGISAGALLAACRRAPKTKLMPFVTQPDDLVPGVASWYASTCGGCAAACGVLVKTRDGRPIKLEGNDTHPVSRGGLCAVGQASVLSLYDASRAKGPLSRGAPTTWSALDAEMRAGLAKVQASGRAIRVLAAPALGPTGEAAMAAFLAAYPAARRVAADPLGTVAIAEAHEQSHGVRAVPSYRFARARLIVSFGADFLGTWVSPVAFTRDYSEGRDAAHLRTMARHYQIEPHLSLTGAAADVRWNLLPSDLVPVLSALGARLGAGLPAAPAAALAAERIAVLARALDAARGASLVVCGSDDPAVQVLVNGLNQALGNYGATLSLADAVAQAPAASCDDLMTELRAKQVGALVVLGANPVYDHPAGAELAALLPSLELSVAIADRADETAAHTTHLAAADHELESWGDSQPRADVLGLCQPTVGALHDTRSGIESLLAWAGVAKTHHDFLRERWQREVLGGALSFEAAWDDAVQAGFYRLPPGPRSEPAFRAASLVLPPETAAQGLELVLYPTVALRDGALANNGWLQELPDPISKVTWGNPAAVAPETAARLGLSDGDVVALTVGDQRVEVPVIVQPGTHPGVVAVGLGHGRTAAGPIGNGVGANAFPLALGPVTRRWRSGLTLSKTGASRPLAQTQTHHSMEGRPLVRETTRDAYLASPPARREVHLSMWPGHDYPGHRWGMAIDLNACTGCSACIVSCSAENNVPVVGADEVRNRREMHWLRIDRYYSGSPAEPQVVNQPVMCQHCENAPCETVCPVLATVHSSEGLNQQVYNRCVGTRYCANNCPYKVRRFNWFDYPHDDPTERMVLNPDVVVRSRGVMEKCSMCVQRIQAGKAQARSDGGPVVVQTACQQSCPAGAIVFGDLNDPTSQVAQLVRGGRAYRLLEEINVAPAVSYLAKLRNPGDDA